MTVDMEKRTDTMETKVASPTAKEHAPPSKGSNPGKAASGAIVADGDADKAPRGPIDEQEAMTYAYLYPIQPVLDAFGIDSQKGLKDSQVKSQREKYGENMLEGGDEISLVKIMFHQVANAMTLVCMKDLLPRRMPPRTIAKGHC